MLALVETIANSFRPEMLMQGGVFFNLITFDNNNGSFLFFKIFSWVITHLSSRS